MAKVDLDERIARATAAIGGNYGRSRDPRAQASTLAYDVLDLAAQVQELRGLVRQAYEEGRDHVKEDRAGGRVLAWERSEARKALGEL